MALPALRQPKIVEKKVETPQQIFSNPQNEDLLTEFPQNVIVTLKCGKKLVVSSDAYHGILTFGELYKCLFCDTEIVLDVACKEKHKQSQNHRKVLEVYPHMEDFSGDLVRKLKNDNYYCTICNVMVMSHFLNRHLKGESHVAEMQKAVSKVVAYKPYS